MYHIYKFKALEKISREETSGKWTGDSIRGVGSLMVSLTVASMWSSLAQLAVSPGTMKCMQVQEVWFLLYTSGSWSKK